MPAFDFAKFEEEEKYDRIFRRTMFLWEIIGTGFRLLAANHSENRPMIWAAKGHGKTVLSGFFEGLTKEQRRMLSSSRNTGRR
jgi:hypothetical protein